MSENRQNNRSKLEIVLKCDSDGSLEAARSAILGIFLPDVEISIIHAEVGDIHKSDLFMAETGSRLIVGYEVGIMPKVEQLLKEHNVEVRLYSIIYRLTEDVKSIAQSLVPQEVADEVTGTAKVIALFKSCRKGIILGCDVLSGNLAEGTMFRVISAMGPIYQGRISSLHIEKNAVQKATAGQHVGLKITDFNKAKIGDMVECYRSTARKLQKKWQPQGKIFCAG